MLAYQYKVKAEKLHTSPANYAELRTKLLEYHNPLNKDQYLEDRMEKYVLQPGQNVLNYITGKNVRFLEYDQTMKEEDRIKKIKKGMTSRFQARVDQYITNITKCNVFFNSSIQLSLLADASPALCKRKLIAPSVK